MFFLQNYVAPPSSAESGELMKKSFGAQSTVIRVVEVGASALLTSGPVSPSSFVQQQFSIRDWAPSDQEIESAMVAHAMRPLTESEERQAFVRALVEDIDTVQAASSRNDA